MVQWLHQLIVAVWDSGNPLVLGDALIVLRLVRKNSANETIGFDLVASA
jgi:hypothetical protein